MNEHGHPLAFEPQVARQEDQPVKPNGHTPVRPIRRFADIPSILTMAVPPVEYIVPALGIARNTITLWTGADGDGKTYLAQAMSVAVARGEEFLGMTCQQSPVLYIDLENPAYTVQDRLQALVGEGDVPNLKV